MRDYHIPMYSSSIAMLTQCFRIEHDCSDFQRGCDDNALTLLGKIGCSNWKSPSPRYLKSNVQIKFEADAQTHALFAVVASVGTNLSVRPSSFPQHFFRPQTFHPHSIYTFDQQKQSFRKNWKMQRRYRKAARCNDAIRKGNNRNANSNTPRHTKKGQLLHEFDT